MATLSTDAKNAALESIRTLINGVTTILRTVDSANLATAAPTWNAPSGGSMSCVPFVWNAIGPGVPGTAVQAPVIAAGLNFSIGGPGSGADIELTPTNEVTIGMLFRVTITITIP